MDGILESGLIANLGPYGLAALALVCAYFLWQRQTSEFSDLKEGMKALLTSVNKSETDRAAERTVTTQQMTAFQVEIASTRPTRQEMNDAFDRMTAAVKDHIAPLRDDVTFIKNAILRGNQK